MVFREKDHLLHLGNKMTRIASIPNASFYTLGKGGPKSHTSFPSYSASGGRTGFPAPAWTLPPATLEKVEEGRGAPTRKLTPNPWPASPVYILVFLEASCVHLADISPSGIIYREL
jgi:hypothetical protein